MCNKSDRKPIFRLISIGITVVLVLSAATCNIQAPDAEAIPQTQQESGADISALPEADPEPKPTPEQTLVTTPEQTPQPTPEPTPEPEPEPPPVTSIKLVFTGDLMLHHRNADHAYDPRTGEYDFNYSLSQITPYLEGDLTIGNLETVLGGPSAGRNGFMDFPRFSAPDAFAHALVNAGFDLLQTSNNHSLDQREAGLLRTLDVLDELGIAHFGTYRSQEDRDTIMIREVRGIRFAFLSYTYSTNGIPRPRGKDYMVNMIDMDLIRADIARARELEPDFVILMPHMGTEYETFIREVHRTQARRMFEAGADIIVSGHPHIVQPWEVMDITEPDGSVRQGFVAYCLGNFISGMQSPRNETGIILNMYFEKVGDEKATLEAISYVPFWVKRLNAERRPDVVSLPLAPLLRAIEAGEDVDLRASDIRRVRNAHRELSEMLLGRDVPPEEMLDEYFIYYPA